MIRKILNPIEVTDFSYTFKINTTIIRVSGNGKTNRIRITIE